MEATLWISASATHTVMLSTKRVLPDRWTERWVDGYMDRWMGRWLGKWMNGRVVGRVNSMGGLMYERMHVWLPSKTVFGKEKEMYPSFC